MEPLRKQSWRFVMAGTSEQMQQKTYDLGYEYEGKYDEMDRESP